MRATAHNVAEPGSGPLQPRRPIPQRSRIDAIRFDGISIYPRIDAEPSTGWPTTSRIPVPTSGAARGPLIRWFDTSAFVLQASFTFGNVPRNSVIGPGYANLDFALAKTWATGGGSRLEFRWEVFNLMNRAQL